MAKRNRAIKYRLDVDDVRRIQEAWLKARRENNGVQVLLNDENSTSITIGKFALYRDYWADARKYTLNINRAEVWELREWANGVEREEWAIEQILLGAGEYTFPDMLYLRDKGYTVVIITSTACDGQIYYACRMAKCEPWQTAQIVSAIEALNPQL